MMKRIWILALVSLAMASCTSRPETQPKVSLIPQPVSVTEGNGVYKLKSGMSVAVTDESLLPTADYLVRALEETTSLKLNKNGVVPAGGKENIVLSLGLDNANPEAYLLTVDGRGITIQGSTVRGVIMGIASLRQLVPVDPYDSRIPYVTIQDEPRYGWRGTMLDVSRHFFTVEQVKEHLDLMSRYKLNKFHWHLSDDQGWRIEIKQYPDLAAKGSMRKFNDQDRECYRLAQAQDDPNYLLPEELMKIEGKDTLYGGYYTQEEVKDIVAYAMERGIDVIPEIDMPGHILAAQYGYPWITCFGGGGEWGEFFSQPLCPGKDSALMFAKNVYSELFSLFPYEYVHLGADEVEKNNWSKCPDCQARIKAYGLENENELQSWFVRDMEAHFIANGRKLIGWDEISEGGLSPTATVMWWRDWARKVIPQTTAAKQNVILSPDFLLYFDFIEGKGDLERIYMTEPTAYQPDWQLSAEQQEYILGVQANIWTEWIPTRERMQYQVFPRILSLSELGWIGRDAKSWESFKTRFIHEAEFLDQNRVNYRIPDLTGFKEINVFTDTARIVAENLLPNVQIRYTTDGTFPNENSTLYTGPIEIDESTDFTFRTFRPDGTKGMMQTAEFRKESYAPGLDVNPEQDGIRMVQYEYKGRKAAEIKDSKRIATHTLEDFIIPADIRGWIGLIYEAYVEVPADGIYTFSILSDDGSLLYIDDKLLIDHDGPHGPSEKVAQKALAKGWHKITVEYFDMNNGGQLAVRMATPADPELKPVKSPKIVKQERRSEERR